MSNTLNLHFEEFGESNATSLVILHGFFASSRNWRQIAKQLAQKYHVYVPDLRNHGLSPHHEEMDYPTLVADVEAFLDQHQIARPYLLGHSMGGKVAMWLALNHPEVLTKPIVIDIAPITYSHSFANTIQALMKLPLARVSNRKKAEELLSEAIPDLSFRQFLLQNLVLQGRQYSWRIDLNIFKQAAPEIIGFPDVSGLTPFSGKSLFVAGAQSTYVEKQHHAKIMLLFPYAKIETLADAGHWLHVEQPKQLINLVNHFLNDDNRLF